MSGPDDRSIEMPIADELDAAIEQVLRGIVVDPVLEPVARVVDLGSASAPPVPSPELAAILAGRRVPDHELSPGAAGPHALEQHWRGTPTGLALVRQLAGLA
jgi:hypothetical protein